MGKGRTIYVKKRNNPHAEKWLEENCSASTGPYPSITGMRNRFWGKDALIVKCGICIYYFGKDTDEKYDMLCRKLCV